MSSHQIPAVFGKLLIIGKPVDCVWRHVAIVGDHAMLLEIRDPPFAGIHLDVPIGMRFISAEDDNIAFLRCVVLTRDDGSAKLLQEWTIALGIWWVAIGVETARCKAFSASHSTVSS